MVNFAAKTNEKSFNAAAAVCFVCTFSLLLSMLGILPSIIIVANAIIAAAIIIGIIRALRIREGHRFEKMLGLGVEGRI